MQQLQDLQQAPARLVVLIVDDVDLVRGLGDLGAAAGADPLRRRLEKQRQDVEHQRHHQKPG